MTLLADLWNGVFIAYFLPAFGGVIFFKYKSHYVAVLSLKILVAVLNKLFLYIVFVLKKSYDKSFDQRTLLYAT